MKYIHTYTFSVFLLISGLVDKGFLGGRVMYILTKEPLLVRYAGQGRFFVK